MKREYEENLERVKKMHKTEMEELRGNMEEELGRCVGGYVKKIRELEAKIEEQGKKREIVVKEPAKIETLS